MHDEATPIDLLDFEPATATFLEDVIEGLSDDKKRLPSKYFYDRRGSQLFDQICDLEEYYLTRAELAVMRQYVVEMAAQIGAGVMLVEYGSGSSVKTRLLLDHLEDPVAYVPVDISRGHLQHTAERLSPLYPQIEILPVCADFTTQFDLPVSRRQPTWIAMGRWHSLAISIITRSVSEDGRGFLAYASGCDGPTDQLPLAQTVPLPEHLPRFSPSQAIGAPASSERRGTIPSASIEPISK